MATIVLRVRLIGGDRMDLTYEEPEVADEGDVIEHVIITLAQDTGVLRAGMATGSSCLRPGRRRGRGSPRGAVV